MMFNRNVAIFSVLLLVPIFFGMGCLRARPRIVQAPTTSTATPDATTGIAALAYVRLNSATADLIRDAATESLQDGQALAEGDEIKVKSGTVELIYPDAGVSQMEAGSDIVLLAQTDAPREGEVAADIQLIAGSVWTRFERLLGNTERFSVTSNGVVATVRGTAFGVSADADGVDVQVADHQVEVTSQQSEEAGTSAKSSLLLQSGQGLKLNAKTFAQSPAAIRRLVRGLNATEKTKPGFLFGAKALDRERLRRPARIIPLLKAPTLPAAYRARIQFLRLREAARRDSLRFGAPTSSPDLNPDAAPATSGTSLQVETKATLFLNGKPL